MTSDREPFFDGSLPKLVEIVASALGPESFADGIFLRDASGRLRFLSSANPPLERRKEIEASIVNALGAYVLPDRAISFRDDPAVERILANSGSAFVMRHEAFRFRLIDRRIVGSAWVERPNEFLTVPPRIVFSSLKGGVGRSTALAVAAADLSRRNKNVLVVDLDLEAPGLGDMLLDGDRMPRLGTLDYLVENGLGGVSDRRLQDFVGTSSLTKGSGGRVDVVPAIGSLAIENPLNTLAKLSRAMIEDIGPNGDSISVTEQIQLMVSRFARADSYDVVLIDSRAGLSELAGPAILGLGATVLLFGTAQNQTIQGYRALFAALRLLAERDRASGRSAAWRQKFKAVYAKASFNEDTAARHRDDLYDLFADNLYDEEVQQNPMDSEVLNFDINDTTAPHWPLTIPFTQGFVDFDPIRVPGQLTASFYEQAYRPFLSGINSIVESNDSGSDTSL